MALVALGVLFAIWACSVVITYWLVRPCDLPPARLRIGGAVVVTFCLVAGLPVVQSMSYAMTQADLVDTVFTSNQTATTPKNVTAKDPWGGHDRVNVLVLGGDGGVDRTGVRTDTVILLSIDTRTGKSVMFPLPRNMMNAQFPGNSPLYDKSPTASAVRAAIAIGCSTRSTAKSRRSIPASSGNPRTKGPTP